MLLTSFKSMIRILLIRHALTDPAGKYLTGRSTGINLNDVGIQQARILIERLARIPITAIYSSPLERALQTCSPICNSIKIECIISDYFNEIDFGDWTNSSVDDLRDDPQFRLFNSSRSITPIPGGEMMAEAQMRIIKGINFLHNLYQDRIVAVISHADIIKSAIAWYAGIHLDNMHRIEISPASVSIIDIYENSAKIILLNETGGIRL